MKEQLQALMKALEAGSYNAAPGTLTQGAALQKENLSPIMQNVTFTEKHLKLQKELDVVSCKQTLYQFDRQLGYGQFGQSAQYEGAIGEEQTSDFVRAVVPMAYYSTTRRVSIAANSVDTVDGVKAEERAAKDAAILLAGDIEFDCFRGRADFSNAGVFDGNPLAAADMPNMVGVDQQIRQSDGQLSTQDLMFSEFGSGQSVVLSANGNLSQTLIEDMSVRAALNLSDADKLFVDPVAASNYNKIAFAKERIVLGGSAQEASGAQLRKQWTSGTPVELIQAQFLRAKFLPQARPSAAAPAAPAAPTPSATAAGAVIPAGTYAYYVTAQSIRGEGLPSASASQAVSAGDKVVLSIPATAQALFFNVYRSDAGGSAASAKFIGRVKAALSGATSFTDLGNRSPASTSGYLMDAKTWEMPELHAYSNLKLAVTALNLPEAYFRFCAIAGLQPRKNVIAANIKGTIS